MARSTTTIRLSDLQDLDLEVDKLPVTLPAARLLPAELGERARYTYEHLQMVWQQFDVKLPSRRVLQRKLVRAHQLLLKLIEENADFREKFSIVLVPPTNVLAFPIPMALRGQQSFSPEGDVVRMPAPTRSVRGWRVVVAYSAPEGLYLGSPRQIIAGGRYLFAKLPMRDLDAPAYAALSLQAGQPIDQTSWTVLLKDLDLRRATECPSARFANGGYVFSTSDVDSIFAADRFRPALEIK